jgi:hypothetical protein
MPIITFKRDSAAAPFAATFVQHLCSVHLALVPKFDLGTHSAETLFRDGHIEKRVVQTTDSHFRPCRNNFTTKLSFLEVGSFQKASKSVITRDFGLFVALGMSFLAPPVKPGRGVKKAKRGELEALSCHAGLAHASGERKPVIF